MECVDGTVIDRMAIAETLPMPVRRGLSRAIPRTLAMVHAVDLDAHGLSAIASHAPYAARQLRRWSRQWEQSKTRELAELGALTDLLRRTAPPQQRPGTGGESLHGRRLGSGP